MIFLARGFYNHLIPAPVASEGESNLSFANSSVTLLPREARAGDFAAIMAVRQLRGERNPWR
jgi:hypothetical protein